VESIDEYRWMFAAEYPAVVRTVYLVLYDYARSQKIAQDAFVQLLQHWEKVRCYEAPEAWVRRVASDIGFDAAYGRSPYLKVCDSWPVGEATAEVGELVRSDVPVLAIIGALGPYVRPDQAREGLGEFSNLSIVVAPADGHNVVAKTDCMLNTRNAWVDNPAMDPAGKACSAGLGLRGICANRSGQASAATRATSGGRLSPSAPPMLLPRSPPNPSRSALKSTIPPRTMTRHI
jgi:hypothetical protein